MTPGERKHSGARLVLKEMYGPGLSDFERQHIRMVVNLYTDPGVRRNGDATELMKQVCAEADREKTVLVLEPEPEEDSPLDRWALMNFYRKFGFTRVQKEPLTLMARGPR
jgi:GNAT superfamily N-acetyltransferase